MEQEKCSKPPTSEDCAGDSPLKHRKIWDSPWTSSVVFVGLVHPLDGILHKTGAYAHQGYKPVTKWDGPSNGTIKGRGLLLHCGVIKHGWLRNARTKWLFSEDHVMETSKQAMFGYQRVVGA
jgi:hypothetical protein